MRKLTAILITAIILTTTAGACWGWSYENFTELIWGKPEIEEAIGADIIITGKTIDEGFFVFGNSGQYTLTYVVVTEVIKGNDAVQVNDVIEVRSTGHRIPQPNSEGVIASSSIDGPFLDLEQDYLLFLWKSDEENRYRFRGANQGVFNNNDSSIANIREIIAAGRPEPTPLVTTPEPVTGDGNPPTSVTLAIIPTLLAGSVALLSIKHRKRQSI